MNIRLKPYVSNIFALTFPLISFFISETVLAQQIKVENPFQPATSQELEDFPEELLKGFYEASLDLWAKLETAEKLAAFARNYYKALMKKGFLSEEALYIVTQNGQPLMINESR